MPYPGPLPAGTVPTAAATLPLSSSADDPITNPLVWQTVYLAGQPSPGFAQVTGWSRDSKIDVKSPPGAQGGTETYRGQPPAKGSVIITVGYDPIDQFGNAPDQQFAALETWLNLLAVDGTKGGLKGIGIAHPALARLNPPVTSVVAEQVGQLEQATPGDSLYTVTLKLIEWRPAPAVNTTSTATTSKDASGGNSTDPGGGQGSSTDPVSDANQQQIAQLNQQLQNTN